MMLRNSMVLLGPFLGLVDSAFIVHDYYELQKRGDQGKERFKLW